MRLNRLRMANFRLHTDTHIQFDSGLTGIIGPNGSGKTTILEAIAWALYGMPAVRGKRQDIRSLHAPARAAVRVELDFELAGHRYGVVRTLSSAELYLDGSSAPIANSTTAVNELLRRRLGMSQQEFFNTYFTGQKELGVMAAMGPAERAQFLSRVLGYEKLRAAQSLAREHRSVLRGELSGLQAAMPEGDVVARAVADADRRLKDAEAIAKAALGELKKRNIAASALAPRWTAAQRDRESWQQLSAELGVRESEAAGLARERDRLTAEIKEISDASAEITALSEELRINADVAAQLHDMERLFQEEGRRKELSRNRAALEQEVAQLRERAARIAAPDVTLRSAEEQRDRLRAEEAGLTREADALRTDWVRDQQEAITRREALKAHYKEIRDQRDRLASLGPDSPCPVCTRPLADHFREVLDDLDGRLNGVEVDGKYYRNRVEQLAEMPAPLRAVEEKLADLAQRIARQERAIVDARLLVQEHSKLADDIATREKRLAEIAADLDAIPSGYHETRHAQLQHRRAQLAPLAERATRLRTLAEREPKVRQELDRVSKDLTRASDNLNTLRGQRERAAFSEDAFLALKASYESAAVELRAAELAALAAEKELEAARTAKASADAGRRELERAQERLRILTLGRRLHDETDHGYADIRADLNQHLRPEIADLASGFLAELTDGRYTDLELDDDYNIIVKEGDVPKPVISGGEEDLAHLVMRLAISQMIAERAGQSFSLLVLDEVFGSLDESRRHHVVELLRRLHDRFEQVVLITHIESVREGLDRVISLRYDEETQSSRVEADSGPALPLDTAAPDEYAAAAGAGN